MNVNLFKVGGAVGATVATSIVVEENSLSISLDSWAMMFLAKNNLLEGFSTASFYWLFEGFYNSTKYPTLDDFFFFYLIDIVCVLIYWYIKPRTFIECLFTGILIGLCSWIIYMFMSVIDNSPPDTTNALAFLKMQIFDKVICTIIAYLLEYLRTYYQKIEKNI